MDSHGNEENSTKATNSNPKVDAKELQHALDVLAKYGIIPNPKELERKTGFGMKSTIIAKIKGKNGKIKETYKYENGKLMEEK